MTFRARPLGVALSTLVAVGVSFLRVAEAEAAGKINYGSKVGMTVSVVSMEGLNTARAIIRTQHTRDDAIGYCRDYVGNVTEECIRAELKVRLNDMVTANCSTGVFTDFVGNKYQFGGRNSRPDSTAAYIVVNLATGEIADGSGASGYTTRMGIYSALCPRTAPIEDDWFSDSPTRPTTTVHQAPKEVSAYAGSLVEECAKAGGTVSAETLSKLLEVTAEGPYGKLFVVDAELVPCEDAKYVSLFCGTGGCTLGVFTSKDGVTRKRFDDQAMGWKISPDGSVLTLNVHGSRCDGRSGPDPCVTEIDLRSGKTRTHPPH